MSYYDNVFTSNLFTGQNNGLNLKSNNLTSKLWTELSMDRTLNGIPNKEGAFFIVKTFDSNDSKIIIDAINAKLTNSFFFDQYGNLYITNGGQIKINFDNILSNKIFNINNTGFSSIDLSKIENPKLIMSEYNKFMLVIENNIVKMLYNPIHRNSFKNYYGTQQTDKSGLNPQLTNLVNKYCEISAVPNTEDGDRKYADKTCKCLGIPNIDSNVLTGECVDDSIGSHITNTKVRNTIGYSCICAAPSCKYDDPNSFMPLFYKNVEKNLAGGNCPADIQITLCQVAVTAGSGVNLSGGQIQQNCGNELKELKQSDTTTKSPTTTKSTTTKSPTTTKSTTTKSPTTTKSTTTIAPTTTIIVTKKPELFLGLFACSIL